MRRAYIIDAENYPPIPTVLLTVSAKFAKGFHRSVFWGFKTLLFLFLFLTSAIFFFWRRSLILASFLQLTLLLNSVALCYIDILVAPTLVASLFAVHRQKFLLFATCFTLSCLTKFQPFIIAPFLLLYVFDSTRKQDGKSLMPATFMKSVVLPSILILIFFFWTFGTEIWSAFVRASLHHPQISANAMNADWILTYFLHRFSPQTFGPLINGRVDLIMLENEGSLIEFPKLIFGIVYLVTLLAFLKRKKSFENLILFALLGYVTYFMLDSGVHENHLFIGTILGVVLYSINPKYKHVALFLSLFSNLNLFLFYGIHGSGFGLEHVWGIDLTVVLSGVGLILFVILLIRSLRIQPVENQT
jgi:hypothetical protein